MNKIEAQRDSPRGQGAISMGAPAISMGAPAVSIRVGAISIGMGAICKASGGEKTTARWPQYVKNDPHWRQSTPKVASEKRFKSNS